MDKLQGAKNWPCSQPDSLNCVTRTPNLISLIPHTLVRAAANAPFAWNLQLKVFHGSAAWTQNANQAVYMYKMYIKKMSINYLASNILLKL